MAIRTGYEQGPQGLTISKDTEAVLTYSFDWSEWLTNNDTITTVEYVITARSNDPDPLIKESSGVQDGTLTYIQLSNGQLNKTYIVTAKVTTADGLIDRRHFRVRVNDRSA